MRLELRSVSNYSEKFLKDIFHENLEIYCRYTFDYRSVSD